MVFRRALSLSLPSDVQGFQFLLLLLSYLGATQFLMITLARIVNTFPRVHSTHPPNLIGEE